MPRRTTSQPVPKPVAVSPATMSGAVVARATNRASAEIAAAWLIWVGEADADTRRVSPDTRSRTKTSSSPPVSAGSRLVAEDSKAT